VQPDGLLTLATSPVTANRQLLITDGGISMAGNLGSWMGTLDLNNNDLDEPNADLGTVTDQIHEGYNNGNWNGPGGIISSAAAADTGHLTALGVIQNNGGGTAIYGNSSGQRLFDGTAPGASDILVKYTFYGDTNLDGKVDGSDYSRIDYGYMNNLRGWYNGDFNYDNAVNGSDYTLIDNAFNMQGAAIQSRITDPTAVVTSQISSVPEPRLGGIAAMIALVTLSSRRRRRVERI